MRPHFRVSWLMYNSKRRRIERRIRPLWGWDGWEPFSANTKKSVSFVIIHSRTDWLEDSLKFYRKKSIRSINQKRLEIGARPVNPFLIHKMRGFRLS